MFSSTHTHEDGKTRHHEDRRIKKSHQTSVLRMEEFQQIHPHFVVTLDIGNGDYFIAFDFRGTRVRQIGSQTLRQKLNDVNV